MRTLRRMSVASRLALAVLLALTGPALAGCSASTELRRVRTPREGVTVAYVLEPGQGFDGTLRLGNTRAIEGLADPLNQTATCDVTMAVVGVGPKGVEIRATFTSVDLDWDLPPAATYSSAELLEMAQTQLRGMQVSFVVRPDGRVQALPAPPPEAPPELYEVIETMLLGLESFFVPLPAEAIRAGKVWEVQLEHTTAEGLSLELDQQLELQATYEHRSEDLVVRRLTIEQARREQRAGADGPITVESEVKEQLMFATSGFPVELDRETRELDPVGGVVFRKVRATWTRARGLVPELVAQPTGDVQVISDPCNPDYVGPRSCDGPDATEPDTEPDAEPAPDADDGEDADADADVPAPDAAPTKAPAR